MSSLKGRLKREEGVKKNMTNERVNFKIRQEVTKLNLLTVTAQISADGFIQISVTHLLSPRGPTEQLRADRRAHMELNVLFNDCSLSLSLY